MKPLFVFPAVILLLSLLAPYSISISAMGDSNFIDATQTADLRRPINPNRPGGPRIVLSRATAVLNRIADSNNAEAFKRALNLAEGIIVFPTPRETDPDYGAPYRKGSLMCRSVIEGWEGPLFVKLEGSSVGRLPSGDLIVFLMSRDRRSLATFEKGRLTLKSQASSTRFQSFNYTGYSFFRIDLFFADIVSDLENNKEFAAPGRDLDKDFFSGRMPLSSLARPIVIELQQLSPRRAPESR